MQLKNLQNKVREYLISREARSYLNNVTLYKETKMEALKLTLAYTPDYQLTDANVVGLDEIQEARQRRVNKLLSGLEKAFSNSEYLALKSARRTFISHQKLINELNKRFSNPSSDIKFQWNDLKDYENSHKGLFQVVRTNDAYVTRLALVAEREGFNKIRQKQTRYQAIRELLTTKKEYIEFAKKRHDELMGLDIEVGGKFVQRYFEVFEQAAKKTGLEEIEKKEFENLIKEIYGK